MTSVVFHNIRGLIALTITCSLLFAGCEREPRALAGYDAPGIEERYGLGAYSETGATIVPVTLSDGRRAQLVIPKNRSSLQRMFFRENGELYPVAFQNPGITREEFIRSEPRIVERRLVEQPAGTVEKKKKRSLEKEILIVAGSGGAGAAIGAIAGGKKGAAVGALSGGIAGLIYDLSTRKSKRKIRISKSFPELFMKFMTALYLILACTLILGCERRPTARAGPESDMALDRAREVYEDRITARLNEFEHRFDGLEARLKGLDRSSYERLRVDLDELRARKAAIEEQLNDLRKVSDHSRHEVRDSLDREIEQLETAYSLVSANNMGN